MHVSVVRPYRRCPSNMPKQWSGSRLGGQQASLPPLGSQVFLDVIMVEQFQARTWVVSGLEG